MKLIPLLVLCFSLNAQVTYDRLPNAPKEPDNRMTYSVEPPTRWKQRRSWWTESCISPSPQVTYWRAMPRRGKRSGDINRILPSEITDKADGGRISTAGGLSFGGSDKSYLFDLDSAT